MNVTEVIGGVMVSPVTRYTLCNFGNTYICNSGGCLVGKDFVPLCVFSHPQVNSRKNESRRSSDLAAF
jgi:hypothetical protein